MQLKQLAITLLSISLLAGCGGGSTGGGSTGGGTVMISRFDYRQSDSPNLYIYDDHITVNLPGTVQPNVAGLPSRGVPHFSATGLPAGLSIDGNSGVISGTPTTLSGNTVTVTMTVEGYTGSVETQFNLTVQAVTHAPLAWTEQTAHAGFSQLAQHRTAMIGNTIYVVGSRIDNQSIETWQSTDKGSTWQKLPVAPAIAVSGFALSSDGTALYLAGGVSADKLASNQVWRFDGTSWSQVPVHTPFSARWGHTLTKLANKWIIVGGSTYDAANNMAVSNLGDVWESTDNGINWVNSVPKSRAGSDLLRTGHCATVLNGKLYVLGGPALGADWSDSMEVSRPDISLSSDGITWKTVLMKRAYFQAFNAACATYNGKIIVVGGAGVDANGFPQIGHINFNVDVDNMDNALLNPTSIESEINPRDGTKPLPAESGYRYSNGMVVIGNQFLIIGGRTIDAAHAVLDDVWMSSL